MSCVNTYEPAHELFLISAYVSSDYKQIFEHKIVNIFCPINLNIWAKIWQKGPSGNKSQKWDIYRERKT